MTLIGATLVTRIEEHRVLQTTLQDRSNNYFTEAECVKLNRVFSAGPLPTSYADVWRDQRDRDEGRLLMAQVRLRATMAQKPPSPGPVSSTGDPQSPQGADESSEGAQADDSPDPRGSNPTPSAEENHSQQGLNESAEAAQAEDLPDLPRTSLLHGTEESQSPQEAGDESKVLQRRGFRHPSEDEDDYDDRLEQSPMIFQERGPDDPVCMDEGLVGLYKVERDSNGNLVRVALFRCMSSLPGPSAGEWPEASCRCFCGPCMAKAYVVSYSTSYNYTRSYSSVKTTADFDLCEHYVKSRH